MRGPFCLLDFSLIWEKPLIRGSGLSLLSIADRRFQFHEHGQLFRTKVTANPCIALCGSKNAVNISSARTMKRFP
jgi:hypothetical protein